jgi:hypothetical protein
MGGDIKSHFDVRVQRVCTNVTFTTRMDQVYLELSNPYQLDFDNKWVAHR